MTHSSDVDADPPRDEEIGATARSSRGHHDGLWATLVEHADELSATADGADDRRARASLLEFVHGDVQAHLQAEADVLYSKARSIGAGDLVATLEIDHRFILKLIEEIDQAGTEQEAARCARALVVLVGARIEKEEKIVLPALVEAGVDVSTLLAGVVVEMATDYDARFSYL